MMRYTRGRAYGQEHSSQEARKWSRAEEAKLEGRVVNDREEEPIEDKESPSE